MGSDGGVIWRRWLWRRWLWRSEEVDQLALVEGFQRKVGVALEEGLELLEAQLRQLSNTLDTDLRDRLDQLREIGLLQRLGQLKRSRLRWLL